MVAVRVVSAAVAVMVMVEAGRAEAVEDAEAISAQEE